MSRSIRPAMTIEDIGRTTIENSESMLLHGEGFSNGWVEFGPKKPPPLVPACLIATRAATGPRAMDCVSSLVAEPSRVVAAAALLKVIGTPRATRATATTRQ